MQQLKLFNTKSKGLQVPLKRAYQVKGEFQV